MINKMVEKDIENYGLLKLTDKDVNLLNIHLKLCFLRDHEYEEGDDEDYQPVKLATMPATPFYSPCSKTA
jgi:ATP-dependent DNA helicase RecQ